VATGWIAVATADRDWFEEVRRREGPDATAMTFPEFCPRRSFPLDGEEVTIGRRSRSRGVEPDIDLTGPPVDPGISAQHARVLVDQNGGWRIVDLDSTNGTVLAGPSGDRPLHPHTPVTLTESDIVKLGAWTTLRLHRP
jgi:pSer/pThr/pTyr-binding forkhead associated (FHA) protein